LTLVPLSRSIKKLKEKEISIKKFDDNEHILHSIRMIVPEAKNSDTVSSTTRFKDSNFKSKGVELFKLAAKMEIELFLISRTY